MEPPKPIAGFVNTPDLPLTRPNVELSHVQGTPGVFQNAPGSTPIQRVPGDFTSMSTPPSMHKPLGNFHTLTPPQIQPGASKNFIFFFLAIYSLLQ